MISNYSQISQPKFLGVLCSDKRTWIVLWKGQQNGLGWSQILFIFWGLWVIWAIDWRKRDQLANLLSKFAVLSNDLLPGHSIELHLVLLQLEFGLRELFLELAGELLMFDEFVF